MDFSIINMIIEAGKPSMRNPASIIPITLLIAESLTIKTTENTYISISFINMLLLFAVRKSETFNLRFSPEATDSIAAKKNSINGRSPSKNSIAPIFPNGNKENTTANTEIKTRLAGLNGSKSK
ncbi:MAG: hypothetical protein OQJ89_13870 [Kangiellaceae bacterium]|nr:hypothetical protein [Kangiellaceae bacterium]MCW8999749.1 hypothetical protein [Kangiellaceae bacterium]MCW9018053.1 hypothetical protein [Kangiellaceae bacterium]